MFCLLNIDIRVYTERRKICILQKQTLGVAPRLLSTDFPNKKDDMIKIFFFSIFLTHDGPHCNEKNTEGVKKSSYVVGEMDGLVTGVRVGGCSYRAAC